MSPVRLAVTSLTKAVFSFHPGAMPRFSRGAYRQEMIAWLFLPMMIGAVEGGVIGVIAKNAFEGTIQPRMLNLAVAVLAGAQAFANVSSFLWAALSHGHGKIRFIVGLILATAIFVSMMALAPLNGVGLVMFIVGVVGARVCWSGVATLRSTVWRANYPRTDRARVAGKFATVQALLVAGTAAAIGLATELNIEAFRLVYPLVGACGVAGALVYSRVRVRGHRALINMERADLSHERPTKTPISMIRLLAGDRPFLAFMSCQFVLGMGNMMFTVPLILVVTETFRLPIDQAVLILATVPILLMPFSIPIWARLLDRVHIIRFRSLHSWVFVAMGVLVYVATVTASTPVLWLAAVLKGLALGGGVLAWNLGHHDFAPAHQAAQYMGVHQTLTGVRGFIAPIAGWWLYEVFKKQGHVEMVFLVCLSLSVAGAIGFVVLDRILRRRDQAKLDQPEFLE